MNKQIFSNRWFIWAIACLIIGGICVMWFAQCVSIDLERMAFENTCRVNYPKKTVINYEDWQKYINEEYGFEFNYPTYFETDPDGTQLLSLKSDKADWLSLVVSEQGLDGYKYTNQSGSYSFTYSDESSEWIPQYKEIDLNLYPKKHESELLIYTIESADGGGVGDIGIIEGPNKAYVIELFLSHNGSVEHYSNSKEFYNILDSINFLIL